MQEGNVVKYSKNSDILIKICFISKRCSSKQQQKQQEELQILFKKNILKIQMLKITFQIMSSVLFTKQSMLNNYTLSFD